VISTLGGASGEFLLWILKSDHDLLIVFHVNLLSRMPGFGDNEVLLQGGYEVIVISSLGGVSHRFC